MRNWSRLLMVTTMSMLAGLGAFCNMAGCTQPESPPVAYDGPTLASGDFGIGQFQKESTGFALLEAQASVGRFPVGLAVAKLAYSESLSASQDSAGSWQIATLKEEVATYWSKLFNTTTAVRDVIVLDRLSVETPEADAAAIAASAGQQGAALCLIYGPTLAEPDNAALTGVIIDTETGEAVAMVRAEAGPVDYEQPHADRPKEDLRHKDPNNLVARKFEQQVRRCVKELSVRDQPITSTQPSPWRSGMDQPGLHPIYVIPNRPRGW